MARQRAQQAPII